MRIYNLCIETFVSETLVGEDYEESSNNRVMTTSSFGVYEDIYILYNLCVDSLVSDALGYREFVINLDVGIVYICPTSLKL